MAADDGEERWRGGAWPPLALAKSQQALSFKLKEYSNNNHNNDSANHNSNTIRFCSFPYRLHGFRKFLP